MRDPPEQYLMKQHSHTPNLSLLIIALLHHYLRNKKITLPFFLLLHFNRIPNAGYFIDPILYHNLAGFKVLMQILATPMKTLSYH